MILLLAMLWCSPARAGEAELRAEIQRQEAVVDALAADVATARARGASRKLLADRMTRYRAEAERLASLQTTLLQVDTDADRAARSEAGRKLVAAIAEDHTDEGSRAILVAWVGEPDRRVELLEAVLGQAAASGDLHVGRAIALDAAEQAGTLTIIARYDAAAAARAAARATTQAAALRVRTAPGQTGGMDLVVSAERYEREAAAAQATAEENARLALRLETIRTRSLELAEARP